MVSNVVYPFENRQEPGLVPAGNQGNGPLSQDSAAMRAERRAQYLEGVPHAKNATIIGETPGFLSSTWNKKAIVERLKDMAAGAAVGATAKISVVALGGVLGATGVPLVLMAGAAAGVARTYYTLNKERCAEAERSGTPILSRMDWVSQNKKKVFTSLLCGTMFATLGSAIPMLDDVLHHPYVAPIAERFHIPQALSAAGNWIKSFGSAVLKPFEIDGQNIAPAIASAFASFKEWMPSQTVKAPAVPVAATPSAASAPFTGKSFPKIFGDRPRSTLDWDKILAEPKAAPSAPVPAADIVKAPAAKIVPEASAVPKAQLAEKAGAAPKPQASAVTKAPLVEKTAVAPKPQLAAEGKPAVSHGAKVAPKVDSLPDSTPLSELAPEARVAVEALRFEGRAGLSADPIRALAALHDLAQKGDVDARAAFDRLTGNTASLKSAFTGQAAAAAADQESLGDLKVQWVQAENGEIEGIIKNPPSWLTKMVQQIPGMKITVPTVDIR